MSPFYYRLKAETYLGVEPLSLLTHEFGEELMGQAWMAMEIENLAEVMAYEIAQQRNR